MKILVTGFTPFGGQSINPAFEAVSGLPASIAGATIEVVQLDTIFGTGALQLEDAIHCYEPNIVLCIGQAGGRAAISVEFVAINYRDASIPDNGGNTPLSERIHHTGDTAYFSNLPVKAMVQHMKNNYIPAYISYSAGTYVCNDVFYHLMYLIHTSFPNVRGGFIHVPFELSQAVNMSNATPSMPIQTITKGIELAIEASILNLTDLPVKGGATH
jgi:pyroglutamyl-peptidase